jgi:hypothetical protein
VKSQNARERTTYGTELAILDIYRLRSLYTRRADRKNDANCIYHLFSLLVKDGIDKDGYRMAVLNWVSKPPLDLHAFGIGTMTLDLRGGPSNVGHVE